MKWRKFKEYIYREKWLMAAILFFIVWKFFLIGILWQDRILPPEPDDSYNYITQIASIASCTSDGCPTTISLQNSSGFAYLSYRLFFGLLAKILQLSPQEIYHLSFYIGTILLAILLPFFLKTFSNNKGLIAWTIFFLSFYHGLGETHGFFWVVPSFFLLLLLLLLFAFVVQEERRFNPWLVGGIAITYTFSHPMSIFLVAIIPLYVIFLNFFTSRVSWTVWKRISLVLFIVFFASLVSTHTFLNKSPKENSYSIRAVVTQIEPSTEKTIPLKTPQAMGVLQELSLFSQYQALLKEKAHILSQVYLRWFLPSWIFIIPFLLGFFILLYKKEFGIISLYCAAFFFFITTTILDSLGYRTAIVLWPATYIFFAFSSWYWLETLQKNIKGWAKYTLLVFSSISIILFFLLNAAFAFFFNENINVRNDYPIEPGFIHYLETLPPESTVTFSREFVIAEMWNIPTIRSRSVHLTTQPNYIVTTNFSEIEEKPRSRSSQLLTRLMNKFNPQQSFTHPQSSVPIPSNYVLEKNFGTFDLYKKLP